MTLSPLSWLRIAITTFNYDDVTWSNQSDCNSVVRLCGDAAIDVLCSVNLGENGQPVKICCACCAREHGRSYRHVWMNEWMKSCIAHVSSWKLFRALHIRKTVKRKSITAWGHQTLVETGEFLTTFQKRSGFSADGSGSPNCSRVLEPQFPNSRHRSF